MYVYVFRQDIDLSRSFDCKHLDGLVRKLLPAAETAVRSWPCADGSKEFFLAMLPLFRQTHDSIRLLCREFDQAHGHTGDALCRHATFYR